MVENTCSHERIFAEKMKKFPLKGLFWDLDIFGKFRKFRFSFFRPQMVRNMLKRALPKNSLRKMKKFALEGIFWDLEIFGKIQKNLIFVFRPRIIGNMLKRDLPKEFLRKMKNKKIPP